MKLWAAMFFMYYLYENKIKFSKNAIQNYLELFMCPMNPFAALPGLVRLSF
jgi:hypothetical protein